MLRPEAGARSWAGGAEETRQGDTAAQGTRSAFVTWEASWPKRSEHRQAGAGSLLRSSLGACEQDQRCLLRLERVRA